jgi:transposase
VGERPTAPGHHRHERPHVAAFVRPTSGEAVWFLSTGLGKPPFGRLPAAFAREAGAGRERHVVLAPDDAGRRGPEGRLAAPDGITPAFPPPCSPELRPAERLWPLVDEPVANRHFATSADLEAVVAERRRRLDAAAVRPHTSFHRWPKPIRPN